jgi:hypothetical protein
MGQKHGGWLSALPEMPAASMAASGPGNMIVVGASVPIRTPVDHPVVERIAQDLPVAGARLEGGPSRQDQVGQLVVPYAARG